MESFITIRGQSCPNQFCFYYQRQMPGTIKIHSQKQRRFQCKGCHKTWVAHGHTVQHGLKSDAQRIQAAFMLMGEGMSVRRISQTIQTSPGTVMRWKTKTEPHFAAQDKAQLFVQ